MRRSGISALGGVLLLVAIGACTPAITPLPDRVEPLPAPQHASGDTGSESASSPPPANVVAVTRAVVRRTIDSLFEQPAFRTASWGALVLGPHGDTIYAHRPAALMVPASNMKIVTTAVALAELGPDYTFRDTAIALPLRDTVPSDFGEMYDTIFVRDHPLREVLPKLLKPSQNRLAEELFYTIGLEATSTISRDSAAAVIKRQLAAWHVPSDGYIIHDGSGFDRADYLSAETITRVLSVIQQDTAFQVFYDALPVAGVDGTLIHRMRATPAASNAHAKTGSLGAIRALSGYVTTMSGERLTFSILCNGFTVAPDVVTGVLDRAVTLFASLAAP